MNCKPFTGVSEANQMLGFKDLNHKLEQTAETYRRTGTIFGEMLAFEGVPLTDSVKVFFSHWDQISRIIAEMSRKRELVGPGVLTVMPSMERVMD